MKHSRKSCVLRRSLRSASRSKLMTWALSLGSPHLHEEGTEVHHGRYSPIDALVPSEIKTLDHKSCLADVCLMNLKCLVVCVCEP
jgi:hypothetical protein